MHDVSKLDFDVCTEPHGYRGPKLGCRLVEIDGQAVDLAGKPYERANAYVAGDSAEADDHGRFVLYAEPGKVSVAAASWAQSILRATGSATVHATAPINTVRVTLHPRISITQATATSVFVHIDGLVFNPGTLTFAIERNPPIENPTCVSQQSQQVPGGPRAASSPRSSKPRAASCLRTSANATTTPAFSAVEQRWPPSRSRSPRGRVGPALSGVGAERAQARRLRAMDGVLCP